MGTEKNNSNGNNPAENLKRLIPKLQNEVAEATQCLKEVLDPLTEIAVSLMEAFPWLQAFYLDPEIEKKNISFVLWQELQTYADPEDLPAFRRLREKWMRRYEERMRIKIGGDNDGKKTDSVGQGLGKNPETR